MMRHDVTILCFYTFVTYCATSYGCSPLGEWLDPQSWFGETEARDIFDPSPDGSLLVSGSDPAPQPSFGSSFGSNPSNSFGSPNQGSFESHRSNSFGSPSQGSYGSQSSQGGPSFGSPSFGGGSGPTPFQGSALNYESSQTSQGTYGSSGPSGFSGTGSSSSKSSNFYPGPPEQTQRSGSGPVLGILPSFGNLADTLPGLGPLGDLFGRKRRKRQADIRKDFGCSLLKYIDGPIIRGKWKLTKGSKFGFKNGNPYGLYDFGSQLTVGVKGLCNINSNTGNATLVSVTGDPSMRNCEQFTSNSLDNSIVLNCDERGWNREGGKTRFTHKLLVSCRSPKKSYCKR